MGKLMTIEEILSLKEPFIFSELAKKGFSVQKNELDQLVQAGELQQKKMGRMNVYWKSFIAEKKASDQKGMKTYTSQLELEIKELKQELMAGRKKIKKLQFQDGIDEPWKEAAMAMARILSEQKQVSMQEVLEYFNAPNED
jgi:hypothetical protein